MAIKKYKKTERHGLTEEHVYTYMLKKKAAKNRYDTKNEPDN